MSGPHSKPFNIFGSVHTLSLTCLLYNNDAWPNFLGEGGLDPASAFMPFYRTGAGRRYTCIHVYTRAADGKELWFSRPGTNRAGLCPSNVQRWTCGRHVEYGDRASRSDEPFQWFTPGSPWTGRVEGIRHAGGIDRRTPPLTLHARINRGGPRGVDRGVVVGEGSGEDRECWPVGEGH